ncbi:MAG: glycosyltransferase family 39 protein [Chloroflexota bacterium]
MSNLLPLAARRQEEGHSTKSAVMTGDKVGVWALLAISAFSALALAARLYRLGAQSIWLDEGLSVLFARPALAELLPKLITDDIHPPFYIVTLHFWMRLAGDGEFAVRFLSAAFGVLLVPLLYRLALDLFAARSDQSNYARLAGLASALLAATSPFLVYYSQEARNYIVVAFWTALSVWALWRAVRGVGRRWWILYVGASAFALYTHYYAGFVLLAETLYLLFLSARWQAVWRRWLLSCAGVVLLYVPWLWGLYGQATNLWLHPDYWPGTLDLWSIASRTFAAFAGGSARPDGAGAALLVFAGLCGVGVAALLARGGLRSGRGELYLAVYVLVPLLAVYAITARYPKFAERYLIIISPAFYLVLAGGLAGAYAVANRLARRWQQLRQVGLTLYVLLVLGLTALSLSGTWRVYEGAEWAKDDYRGAVAAIEARAQSGDIIILTRNTYQAFLYYYDGGVPWHGLDAAGPGGTPDVNAVAARLDGLVKGRQRVWHLLWQEEITDATSTVGGLLRKYGRQVDLGLQFIGVRLHLYELSAGVTVNPQADQTLRADYENGLRLHGIDLPSTPLVAGQPVPLAFYWEAVRQLGEDIGLSIALKDEQGLTWGQDGCRISGHYLPPSRWPVGTRVRSECPSLIPVGTPPGHYTLELNVHLTPSLRELSRVQSSGQPVGTRLALGQVTVLTSDYPPAASLDALGVTSPSDTTFASGQSAALRLLGRGKLPESAQQGGTFDLNVAWEALSSSRDNLQVAVKLVGAADSHTVLRQAVAVEHPTSRWVSGERLRGQYRILVPANLPEGDYDVRLALLPTGSLAPLRTAVGEESVGLGRLAVTGLPRVMKPPAVDWPTDARFGEVAALNGFEIAGVTDGMVRVAAGDTLSVILVWHSLQATDTRYTAFVHLADENGRPWAQQDSPPALGARPTTSWLPGEYVSDARSLTIGRDVPTGRYRLLVGMYGPDGKRLPASTSGAQAPNNSVALPGVMVEVTR